MRITLSHSWPERERFAKWLRNQGHAVSFDDEAAFDGYEIVVPPDSDDQFAAAVRHADRVSRWLWDQYVEATSN